MKTNCEKKLEIKEQKKQKKLERLREAQIKHELQLQEDLDVWARELGISLKEIEAEVFLEFLFKIRHNRPITSAHIKGSKSHNLISAKRRKKGTASKIRRRVKKLNSRYIS